MKKQRRPRHQRRAQTADARRSTRLSFLLHCTSGKDMFDLPLSVGVLLLCVVTADGASREDVFDKSLR